MTSIVTKNMVELYILGVLSPDRRREVEEAFDASPQVQEWFLELDALPEHVQAEYVRDQLLDHIAEYRGHLANRADRELFEFVEVHASTNEECFDLQPHKELFARLARLIIEQSKEHRSRELGAAFDELVGLPHGGICRTMDFTQALADADVMHGSPPETLKFSGGPAGKDICEQHGGAIYINCEVQQIPHGLVWLGLVEHDGTVTMHLPELDRIVNRWVWRAEITDLLGGRKPVSPVKTHLLPATPENRAAFDCDEVRLFVKGLPSDSEQRLLAERLVTIKGENAHE